MCILSVPACVNFFICEISVTFVADTFRTGYKVQRFRKDRLSVSLPQRKTFVFFPGRQAWISFSAAGPVDIPQANVVVLYVLVLFGFL